MKRGPATLAQPAGRRRGVALIVAMWIVVALAGLVLIMSNAVRIEAGAIANRMSLAKVEAAMAGAEKYVLALVAEEIQDPGASEDYELEAIPIGDCFVWIIRPNYDDDGEFDFGLIDESARIDINTATRDMLLELPGMTENIADAIIDWRDSDSTVSSQGAEDEYYLTLPDPYRTKNGPFESVEELLLVRDITTDLLFGYDSNRNGVIDPHEAEDVGLSAVINQANRGIAPFVTAWGLQAASSNQDGSSGAGPDGGSRININAQDTNNLRTMLEEVLGESRAEEIANRTAAERPFANVFEYRFEVGLTLDEFTQVFPRIYAGQSQGQGPGQGDEQPTVALVNVNRAPAEVLLCLPGLDEADVSAIISDRESHVDDPANIAWLSETLTQEKVVAIGGLVTGSSQCFSAEIVVVSGDGRAFKRCRVVVDARQGTPRISYRKDLTHLGWPLPPELREEMRAGEWLGESSPLMRGVRSF